MFGALGSSLGTEVEESRVFLCFDGFCIFCLEGEWLRVSGPLRRGAFRNAAVRSFSLAHQPLPDLIRAGRFPLGIDPKMATETLAETLISVRGPTTKSNHLHYLCNMGHSCFCPSCFPRKIVRIRTGFPRLPSFRQESDLYWWQELYSKIYATVTLAFC